MSGPVRYTIDQLRDLRDGLDDILTHLEAHPFNADGTYETNRNLRPTGFTMHVKFGKGAEMPIMPPTGGTRSVFNLAEIGFNPALLSQVLNQLIETLETTT